MPLNADFDARNLELYKYPRTQHLQGSRLQPGDEDLESVPFSALVGRHLVIEEKMDGANAAISFSQSGELLLQSRGHYLTGGNRERHFALFKQWGYAVGHLLRPVLQDRYVLYGEWLFAKHTIFYDQLPHYFLEFDLLDRVTMSFLSTERRHELLANLPIVSVKVLAAGKMNQQERMTRMVGSSYFISPNHRQRLRELSEAQGLSAARVLAESDPSGLMEGLYIKVEEDGVVKGRYKYVRTSFLTSVIQSESHWLARPIVPNQLADGVDIFVGAAR